MNIKQKIWRRHFIGEVVKIADVVAKKEHKAEFMVDVRIIAKYRDFAIVTNGIYNWCVGWLDLEGRCEDE